MYVDAKHKAALTVSPFQFDKNQPPDTFECFLEEGDKIIAPRYWAIAELGMKPTYPPYTPDTNGHDWTFKGDLRPSQQDIMRVLEPVFSPEANGGGGILSIVCGGGKTCCAIYLLTRLKVKTLIVVHKSQLVKQWMESIDKFTNLPVGRIQQSTIDAGPDKPVVIGMLQSLSMKEYPREVLDLFQFLIVDEVHNVATRTFSKLLLRVTPPYTLGLSATPQRPDGTSKVFHWFLGPMLYRITAKQAAKGGDSSVTVKIHKLPATFKEIIGYQGQVNLSAMITGLAESRSRTDFIVDKIKEMANLGRNILVLSSRIEQLRNLNAAIPDISSLYVGSMKQAELDHAIKNAQVLLATYEMANEGFDLPRLNTLLFATPRSRIEQAVGRILRKRDPDNPPIVIDIVDLQPSFKKQGDKRRAFYKSLGYTIE